MERELRCNGDYRRGNNTLSTHKRTYFPARLSAIMGKKNKKLKVVTEADPLDVPDAIPDTASLNAPLPVAELNTAATKADILELMRNIRKFFNADLAIVREEITAIRAQVQATEGNISATAQRQTGAAEQQAQLHNKQQTLSH
ncbi:Hypothetical predicted protein [Pelobates cultripes]|uniref:Uncharacterized protein n=1 Tax=Pelobates cultripes TaxID=61616 RepID=A0AAD1T906_PELCU|nr:Hypothetical predicted protein [Pelobates cultripes]